MSPPSVGRGRAEGPNGGSVADRREETEPLVGTLVSQAPSPSPSVAAAPHSATGRRLPWWAWVAVLGLGVVAFSATASDYTMFLANTFLAYAVASLGVVFLVGWGGLISFAQGAFFGLAAYVTAHLVRDLGVPFPFTVLLAAATAAVAAVPMALPAVRLRGVYLALATLAYQAAVERYLFRQYWFTLGGEAIPIGRTRVVGGITLVSARSVFWALLPFVVLAYLALAWMRRTKVGRAVVGMRVAEEAMAACGVPIPAYRLVCFVGGAWLTGLGGALLTHALATAPGSNEFTIVKSTVLLAIAVVGGLTRLEGAFVGSALFVGLPELVRRLHVQRFNLTAVMGLLLLLVALLAQGGVLGLTRRAWERQRARGRVWARLLAPVPPPRAPLQVRALRIRLADGTAVVVGNGAGGERATGTTRGRTPKGGRA